MWILFAIVLKLNSPLEVTPVVDKPLIFNSLEQCENNMDQMFNEYIKLKFNYPVEVEYKTNDNRQRYMVYSYKSDYTKPKVTTYYYCIKAYSK